MVFAQVAKRFCNLGRKCVVFATLILFSQPVFFLEHFKRLPGPLKKIKEWPDGYKWQKQSCRQMGENRLRLAVRAGNPSLLKQAADFLTQ